MGIVLLSFAVNALLIALVYLLARRRINRLLGGGETLDLIKEEINRLVVELNQTSDRNIGIIEERLNRLRKLIDEADRKIMLLGKESEKVRLGADVYDKLKKSKSLVSDVPINEVETEVEPDEAGEAVSEIVPMTANDGLRAQPHRRARVASVESPAAREGRPVISERKKPATPAEKVLALHRQGFDPKIIAARTGSPLGEIELIISLADGTK